MIEFFNYIWMHFTGISWGWWTSTSIVIPENIEATSIFFVSIVGSILVLNLFHFIVVAVNNYSWNKAMYFYIPAAISYMILNIILHTLMVCIFITIGGLTGFIAGGLIYIVAASVGTIISFEEEDSVDGYFNLLRFIKEYSKDLNVYFTRKSTFKKEYEKFLKLQY